MSKKRKTRKQKEIANLRHSKEIEKIHLHSEANIYSIPMIKVDKKSIEKPVLRSKEIETFEQKDIAYLKHDIMAITAASGIVVAFDILLFVLLSSGILRLNFLGY